MNEKARRNILLQLLFLAALIGATFWWLCADCDVETMLATLKNATPRLIGSGAFVHGHVSILRRQFGGGALSRHGTAHGVAAPAEIPPSNSFSAPSRPSSSGGQPFEVLFMRMDGYKVTESTGAAGGGGNFHTKSHMVLFFASTFEFRLLHAQVAGIWFLFLLGLF